ncbi:hypothetical protein D7V93_16355 [Corallococcus llansteffanensis]|uniref:Uncharacterized protein n=1 Tax=Corallococcus llansteffanensis TaxID=2316731 RepID=A0A3A8PRR5_9BACT|nr:hypothetical protein D7V93_16355 [Corallococcus llansteffanensis]
MEPVMAGTAMAQVVRAWGVDWIASPGPGSGTSSPWQPGRDVRTSVLARKVLRTALKTFTVTPRESCEGRTTHPEE